VPDSEPIPFRYSFTAGPNTISELAWAWLGHHLRQRSTIAVYVLFVVTGATVLATSSSFTIKTVLGAFVVALFPMAFVLLANYVRTRRFLTRVLRDGVVLQTGFGESALVTAGPNGSSQLNYSALRSIVSRGPAVFIRLNGSPLTSIFPRELFPEHELQRVRLAMGPAGAAAPEADDHHSS
jgi:hypothetical protein